MEVSRVPSYCSIVPHILDDDNYDIWSSCMEDYLLGQDLWDVIVEAEAVPEIDEEAGGTLESSKSIIRSWRKKNALALHAIKMSCSSQFLYQIFQLNSAKLAWDVLAGNNPAAAQDYEGWMNTHEDSSDVEDGTDYGPFVDAIKGGDWVAMERLVKYHPRAVAARVFRGRRTALHYALDDGKETVAEWLVDHMEEKDLEIVDGAEYTALGLGATHDHPRTLKLLEHMHAKNGNLANVELYLRSPVVLASSKGFKSTTRFLYEITDKNIMSPEHGNGMLGIVLLNQSINIKLFDVASDIVNKFPNILHVPDDEGTYPIHALAKTFSAFSNGTDHKKSSGFNQRLSDFGDCVMEHVCRLLDGLGVSMACRSSMEESAHEQFTLFLRLVCEKVSTFDVKMMEEVVYSGMIEAAKNGNIEFITEMVKANPLLYFVKDEKDKNLVWYAVENRQEKVFNLIYWASELKDSLLSFVDDETGNNILHLAATLGVSSGFDRTSGPALQMQRELQWFKEVWNLVKARNREALNSEKLTPPALFTKSHEKLMEAAEKYMKDTAQSATTIGTLIVTIMFAAAFTVPGGNNQDTGYPLFVSQALFKIFIVCDALSLYSSVTSVLIFLGILLSRYSEEDFLLVLPMKLMIGVFTLFFSIATMMVTFCAALAIMLHGRLQLVLPITLLAFVPVSLFVSSIFPLLFKIYKSTLGPSIFRKTTTKLPNGQSYVRADLPGEAMVMNGSAGADKIV